MNLLSLEPTCLPTLSARNSASTLLSRIRNAAQMSGPRLTEIMGIVDTSIHSLASFGRVCMACVTHDEYAIVDREFRCDTLANDIERPRIKADGLYGVGKERLLRDLHQLFWADLVFVNASGRRVEKFLVR